MSTTRFGALAILALLATLGSGPLIAHHSFAMFDHDKEVTIDGVIKEFQWTNPHAFIQVMVTEKDGKAFEYSLEGGSPGILSRNGWKRGSLQAGDKVKILYHPLKDGTRGGAFFEVHKADGQILYYHA